ncbi:MAG: Uma2 family endonuclease [Labilithrix sp.]|nr:Uma2 family endonuclease [Labilithrix sp.]
MAQPARKPATYEDLRAVPSNRVGELLHGIVYSFPRPAMPHAIASAALGEELGPPFKRGKGGPGGWLTVDEPELHLVSDVLVPDLAGWRRERLPATLDVAAMDVAPDWVCEVLSPSTESIDRADKASIYLREQVRHMWFVDPIAKTLEVFRLDGETYRMVHVWRDDAVVRAEPFDAIELELAVLWAR